MDRRTRHRQVASLAIANMKQEVEIEPSAVTVCICTFRRTSLRAALDSLADQILPDGGRFQIIVVDNDLSRTAESIVTDFRIETTIHVDYFHAPYRNISIARNAGIAACQTRWLAFLDDDETVAPDWLDRLMRGRDGAVAVFGRCAAIYSNETPRWIRIGDYHSSHIISTDGVIETGHTSNVLIDTDFVRAHRLHFKEEYGRTGGEDTVFFYEMHQCGGRLAYAPDAVAYEDVPNTRKTLSWVATRRYRAGQTYAKLQHQFQTPKYRIIPLLSPIKIAWCFFVAAMLTIRPDHGMWWFMRGVFHLGMLNYRLSGNVHEEYGAPAESKGR